jgi:hypothetical protein
VSVERIHEPGVRIPSIRRRVSILVEAATIEYQSAPHHFIWKTAAGPCKLHSHCDITLGRYCETDRSQYCDVRDAPTPPTSQPDIRYATTRPLSVPVCAQDSRFQICVECGKKQSAALRASSLCVDEPLYLQGLRCCAVAVGDINAHWIAPFSTSKLSVYSPSFYHHHHHDAPIR